ncbi:MAG: pilus assembly protein TadG-related protein, partial [Dehalococcoidia bacterium]
SGQALVVTVLALTVLLGMVAMTIDVGLAFRGRRHSQNAADAAALAGVQHLPGDGATAIDKAQEWATNNGFDDGVDGVNVTATTPYNGNPQEIEVVIDHQVPTLFARVLGFESWDVSTRAVAHRDEGYFYAVYTHEGDCSELKWSASDIDVKGDIHSNGSIKMASSTTDVEGKATYLCEAAVDKNSNFSGGVQQVAEEQGWPVDFEYEYFTNLGCTFFSTDSIKIDHKTTQYWLNDDPESGVLKDGLYCSDKNILVATDVTGGNVTFAAKEKIDFKGGDQTGMTPYVDNVLAFAGHVGADALEILSPRFEWEGLLIAKHGHMKLNPAVMRTSSGSILAESMSLNGSTYDLAAPLDEDSGFGRLIE